MTVCFSVDQPLENSSAFSSEWENWQSLEKGWKSIQTRLANPLSSSNHHTTGWLLVSIEDFLHWVKCCGVFQSYSPFLSRHTVENSIFLYHSDFTWIQFWGYLKCKISHLNIFWGSEFWFSGIFPLFGMLKLTKRTKFTAHKMAVFALQKSSKLISRKIWVMEKSWNFHTVRD